MIQRGRLYWVHLDKRRPALVVSPGYRNEHASDVLVIPCSTRMRFAPTHIALRRGEGGVDRPSVLHAEQITTLSKSDVEPKAIGGPLSATRMTEVERGVLRAIGIPIGY